MKLGYFCISFWNRFVVGIGGRLLFLVRLSMWCVGGWVDGFGIGCIFMGVVWSFFWLVKIVMGFGIGGFIILFLIGWVWCVIVVLDSGLFEFLFFWFVCEVVNVGFFVEDKGSNFLLLLRCICKIISFGFLCIRFLFVIICLFFLCFRKWLRCFWFILMVLGVNVFVFICVIGV